MREGIMDDKSKIDDNSSDFLPDLTEEKPFEQISFEEKVKKVNERFAKVFCLFLWLCINVLCDVGECCESVPLDHTGSYILSA